MKKLISGNLPTELAEELKNSPLYLHDDELAGDIPTFPAELTRRIKDNPRYLENLIVELRHSFNNSFFK